MLLPDAPVDAPQGRVRALARDGFLLLTGGATDLDAVLAAAAEAPGPVRVLALRALDPDGTLTATLGARPDEVWIVRPDAHVAAVLPAPTLDDLTTVLERAVRADDRHGVLQVSP